ncbi:unnamed protein product [Arctia plantaginis]|uniref:U1-type domain-containing protein n=1 Tax=Arctia plantaginis TaxID=874455 RepID=A0A8S1B162_ARCPL|nr:unnamed protein product [Arctia plantaginis]
MVPDDQKLAHGLSVEHLKSTDKESALNVFVEMFIDKKREECEDLDDILFYEVEDDEVDSGLNPHQPEARLALLEHNRAKENELNAMQPTTSTNDIATYTCEPHTCSTDQTYNVVGNAGVSSEIQEFKVYAKSMRDNYKINVCGWIKVDDPCHLTVAAPNGNILKITVDIFHSFTASSSVVLCMVCDKLIALDTKKLHIANEKHARLISRPIDNMFRRKINGLWSHDLVSNKYYLTRPEDATAKGNDKPHPVNNTPKVTEAPTLTNKNNTFVHCEVCDIYIHGHDFAGHVKGKNHWRNQRKIDKQNIKATQNSVQTQEDQQEYGITQDHVDDRNGPMDVEAFMVYLKKMVSKYNLKYTLPIVKNGGLVVVTSHGFEAATTVESFHGYKPTESSMFCQMCQMTVSVNTRVHSETLIHVKNITQAIDVHFTRKISVVMSHCLLCNLTVSDSAEHAATNPTHYSYMRDRVSNVKQIECTTDKKWKLTHCDVCNIYLTPNTYQDHLKSKKHLQTIREYSDQRETPANMIFCPICFKTIHCNSFQDHCKGKRHSALAKRTARESQTQSEPTDQGDRAHSSLTTANQHETNFLEYLKSMIAKFKLNCELPIVEDGGVVITTPNGNREKFTIEAFHSYKQAESSVVCQVCRMNVLSKDTRAHSMTRLHVVNILKPVDNNFSRKVSLKAIWYCSSL